MAVGDGVTTTNEDGRAGDSGAADVLTSGSALGAGKQAAATA